MNAFQYYKIEVTQNSGFFSTTCLVDIEFQETIDFTPTKVDIVNAPLYKPFDGPVANSYDGDPTTSYCVDTTIWGPLFVVYDLGVEKELSRYKIIVSEFPGPATPYSWVLYGCNDENCYSSDTTKLDEQTGFDTITWANKYSNGVSLPLEPYLLEVSVLAAPTYDIALIETGCVFTASAEEDDTNFGTMSCTFDAKGDSDHSVISELFGSDCKSPVTSGLIQENLTLLPLV